MMNGGVFITYFNVLFQPLLGGAEENHDIPLPGCLICGQKLEPGVTLNYTVERLWHLFHFVSSCSVPKYEVISSNFPFL